MLSSFKHVAEACPYTQLFCDLSRAATHSKILTVSDVPTKYAVPSVIFAQLTRMTSRGMEKQRSDPHVVIMHSNMHVSHQMPYQTGYTLLTFHRMHKRPIVLQIRGGLRYGILSAALLIRTHHLSDFASRHQHRAYPILVRLYFLDPRVVLASWAFVVVPRDKFIYTPKGFVLSVKPWYIVL